MIYMCIYECLSEEESMMDCNKDYFYCYGNDLYVLLQNIKKLDKRKYRRLIRQLGKYTENLKKDHRNIYLSMPADCWPDEMKTVLFIKNSFIKRRCPYHICFTKKATLDFLKRYGKIYKNYRWRRDIRIYDPVENREYLTIYNLLKDNRFAEVYKMIESMEWKDNYFFICAY